MEVFSVLTEITPPLSPKVVVCLFSSHVEGGYADSNDERLYYSLANKDND
jgi:hypothetical protein